MSDDSPPEGNVPSSYVVLLIGTHVTGKETLAVSLSKSLGCPWLKAEMAHNSAGSGARSQAKRGYSYGETFGRIFFSKLRRMGFLADGNESDGELQVEAPRRSATACTALITCYAMQKVSRDAIRRVMQAHSIIPLFVTLHITKETLSGRTLGAEEPELADRIMKEKMADVQEPLREETDVLLIDSTRDIDALFVEIMESTSRLLSVLQVD